MPNNKKPSFEEVKDAFRTKGFTLLESEYINQYTKMKFICPSHPNEETYTTYKNLKTRNGCEYCSGKKRSIEEVKSLFEQRGYELLENTYRNNRYKMKYNCPEHGIKEISFDSFSRGSGCKECYSEGNVGSNHPSWKGGLNDINDSLRKLIKNFTNEYMEHKNFTCEITKEKGCHLEVHHLKPFNVIRDECFEKLSISNPKEITDEQRRELFDLFLKEHKKVKLILIKKELHDRFHNKYGDKFSEEDFTEFISNLKGGETF